VQTAVGVGGLAERSVERSEDPGREPAEVAWKDRGIGEEMTVGVGGLAERSVERSEDPGRETADVPGDA